MLVNAFKYINEMLNRVTTLEVGGIKKNGEADQPMLA